MFTLTSTLLGTISTSITLPFLSYAFKGTSLTVWLPTSWFTIFSTSNSALTVATWFNWCSAPLMITLSVSIDVLSITNLESSLSLFKISTDKSFVWETLSYIVTFIVEGLTIYSRSVNDWLYLTLTLCWPGFNPVKSTVTSYDDICFAINKSVLLPISVISTVLGNPSAT